MEPRSFSSTFSEINFREARAIIRRSELGPFRMVKLWGPVLAFIVLSFIPPLILAWIIGHKPHVLITLALYLGTYLLLNRAYCGLFEKKYVEDSYFAGVTKVDIDAEKIRFIHPGHEEMVRWSHVKTVLASQTGLSIVLPTPNLAYKSISASAFENRDEMEQVAEQMNAWIKASKIADEP